MRQTVGYTVTGMLRRLLPLGFFLSVLCAQLAAQTYYPFDISQDELSGAPDFSRLNHPLTPADRLFVRDGHFFRVGSDLTPNTGDDERVRLYGVNFAFGASFPQGADAVRVARRLRRLGVNLVRLHHMDSWLGDSPTDVNGLLTTAPYPTLNPAAVTRLRGLLDAFSAEGIYVDLNLHVGYEFRPTVDNVPPVSPFPPMSKPLQIFYPRMIELQKDYVRKVVQALGLQNDPVLGVAEIDNETSLIYGYQDTWEDYDQYITGAYRDELRRQWNAFLTAKYGSTERLRTAWGVSQPDGPQLLGNSWILELHDTARAALDQVSTPGTVKVSIYATGGWIIVKNVGFSIDMEHSYVADVELRADLPAGTSKQLSWIIMRDGSPWDGEASINVQVTNQWQKFRLAVLPKFPIDGNGRFHLQMETVGATSYIRNWSFRVAGPRGLNPDESLESGNVELAARGDISTSARESDYILFLTDRDRNYLREMLGALRETAGPLVPVTGTQMGYGGLANLDSHQDLNYQDNHFYVDHYGFPNSPWDWQDWTIADDSSLAQDLLVLHGTAATRTKGRPFTVSEYNQPWPNSHSAEMNPTLASFAAFQDWDALLHYNYKGSSAWDTGVPSNFELDGDWTQYPVFAQSAWMFRSGAIQSGAVALDLPVTEVQRLRATAQRYNGDIEGFLTADSGYAHDAAFLHPVRLAPDSSKPLPDAAKSIPPPPYRSETGESTFDKDARRWLIHSPQVAGVIGFLNRDHITAGPLEVELASTTRGFATILLTSLDGKPITESASLLLSTPAQALRTQPGSSPARPQLLVHYGSTNLWTLEKDSSGRPSGNVSIGQKPMWMERVESTVTLQTNATSIDVFPLDGAGRRLSPLPPQDVLSVAGGFRIHIQAAGQTYSLWYEIAALGIPDSTPSTVSSASYAAGPQARESIVSTFNAGLASAVTVRDINGTERNAPVFYASASQVNYQIPPGTVPGPAVVTFTTSGDTKVRSTVSIVDTAPGIYQLSADGLAAAGAVRVATDGKQSPVDVFAADPSTGALSAVPIDLGPESDRVYLILYATGIRFRSSLSALQAVIGGVNAPVIFAGAQGGYVGLDQVNVLIPRSLAGRGDATVQLTVDGKPSNSVRIRIR
jgi:uncharacterized protein (TIGR03437 family)